MKLIDQIILVLDKTADQINPRCLRRQTMLVAVRMKTAFYEGELWKNKLEAITMPMIESYDVILCETSPGNVFDGTRQEP